MHLGNLNIYVFVFWGIRVLLWDHECLPSCCASLRVVSANHTDAIQPFPRWTICGKYWLGGQYYRLCEKNVPKRLFGDKTLQWTVDIMDMWMKGHF